jgi:hypothetical protein
MTSMRINTTFRRSLGLAGAVALLTAGVAVTQATGDSPAPPTRAEALLSATQSELTGTQHSVSAISLEHVVDGREVYALTGTDTACILIAGVDQPLGRSQSLSCTNTALASPEQPMQSGFRTASGSGYVDLVWVGDEAPAQVSTTGAPVSVDVGSEIISARRSDDTTASALSWQAPAADTVAVELPSRAERAEHAEPVTGG